MIRIYLLLAAFVLQGCSTLPMPGEKWSYNPANYQGCVYVLFESKDTKVTYIDCKDKSELETRVDLNSDGKVDLIYSATDIVGSNAAEVRSKVESIFSENSVDVAPEIINQIIKTLIGQL